MRFLATANGSSAALAPAQAVIPASARRVLLVCGIASSLLYVAMNVFVPMLWKGYSWTSQTVSELSALGAPTRPLWAVLGVAYALLVAAFGLGVWSSAGRNRALRVVGASLMVAGVVGLAWPPMHQRFVLAAGGGTLTDSLHIAWTMVWGLLALVGMGFGAAAFGMRFRLYTIVTIVILAAFGALTSVDAPRITADQPTPWVGVWERTNIASYLLWVVVLATILLRERPRDGFGRVAAPDDASPLAGDLLSASSTPRPNDEASGGTNVGQRAIRRGRSHSRRLSRPE
jgi:hypothetical protein